MHLKPVKAPLFLSILVFLPVLLLLAGCQPNTGSVLPFIKRVTTIQFPEHLKTLAEYGNGEYESMGKYLIPPQEIPAFITSHPFVPVPVMHPRPPLTDFNFFCHSDLIPLSDSIPSPDSVPLHYFTGCRPGNAWTIVLNEKTGELWINIQYPDWGGTGAECKL